MQWIGDPQTWAALLTLTVLEIVLGVDNVVLVTVLANRLSPAQRPRARRFGLMLALATRLLLLAGMVWLTRLTAPLFEVFGRTFSYRDVILVAGGLFLVYSGTREIHGHIEGHARRLPRRAAAAGLHLIVAQMVLLDMVFSLDSIITAVGMATEFWIMATAIIIAMSVMLAVSAPIAAFIDLHPSVKMLVLSFLLLIGTALVADGCGFHIPRGYIYAAIGFSVVVEALQHLTRRRRANSRSHRGKDLPATPRDKPRIVARRRPPAAA